MEYRALGPLEVVDGDRVVDLGPNQQRGLLAVLLCHRGETLSAHALAEALWNGRPPRSAVRTLQVYVHHLRRALGGADRIVSSQAGYSLRAAPEALDSERFIAMVTRGQRALRTHDAAAADDLLSTALNLWRGAAFAGLTTIGIVAERAAILEEHRLAAHESHFEAQLALGRHAAIIADLTAQAAQHPHRERFCGLLMLALYGAGRQAEALAAYRSCRDHLVEEFGIEPGPDLQRLHSRILRGDATLLLRPGAGLAPSTAPRGANLLPADIADFVGRQHQIEHISQRLTSGRRGRPGVTTVVSITGPGGVGKTRLAVRVAHRVAQDFPDGQLYADLGGPGAQRTDISQVLVRFLRALGVAAEHIPEDLAERIDVYRSLTASRQLLVVLDNAGNATGAESLVPAAPTGAVLITSRTPMPMLAGAHRVPLDVLTPGESLELLRHMVGAERIDAEPDSANELARLCGFLPLAIRIAGAKLSTRPHWPVDRIARRLRDERGRLDELAIGDQAVRASLSSTYAALTNDLRQALCLLSVPDVDDFGLRTAVAALGVGDDEGERLVGELVGAQLLQIVCDTKDPATRFGFHHLVRLFARERAVVDVQDDARRSAVLRTIEAYRRAASRAAQLMDPRIQDVPAQTPAVADTGVSTPSDVAEAVTWTDAEHENLVAVVQQAATLPHLDAEVISDLADRLFRPLDMRGHWLSLIAVNDRALEVAARHHDVAAEARAHNALAVVHGKLGHADREIEGLHEALSRWQTLGNRHREASALNNLGTAHSRLKRFHEALTYQQASLAIGEELGDTRATTRALANLGRTFQRLGQLADARAALDRVLSILADAPHPYLEWIVLLNLGHAHRLARRSDDALDCYHRGLELLRELGERYGEAEALWSIGDVWQHLTPDQDRARRYRNRALTVLHELGELDAVELQRRLEVDDPEPPLIIGRNR